TVDPTEAASNNIHAIKIPLILPSQYYLVEVRAQIGYDVPLPATGVLITFLDNNLVIGQVHVIDSHPNVPNLMDAIWTVGQTFTDSANNMAITVASKNGNSYQVTVNRGGGQPPPPQNQTTKFIQLAITGINAQPAVIINPNMTVTISIQISNVGTIAANNVSVQVTLDGQPFTNLQVSNVAAGSSTQTSFTWISTNGGHVFQVTLDPTHTINEPSRANHTASFNVNVGTTLSINIPANIASSGNIWVLINGVRYNFNSTQVTASVSTKLVTVQIQSLINASLGVRQAFTGWSDGSSSNPRQLTVTSSIVIQAVYATEYLLSINQNGGSTTPSSWHIANSAVSVSANTPSGMIPNWSRLVFTGWSGDYNSNSPSLSITMTKPFTLQANWIRQYYVTVVSPTGSPSGAGWYNAGSLARLSIQPEVDYNNKTRRVFTGWTGNVSGTSTDFTLTANKPINVAAQWTTQYQITFKVAGLPNSTYVTINVNNQNYQIAPNKPYSTWYNQGQTLNPTTTNQTVMTFFQFSNWHDSTGSNIVNPITVNSPAEYTASYQFTFCVWNCKKSIGKNNRNF